MIEAVNSVLSNAQALRAGTDSIDVAREPIAVQPSVTDINVPVAPFISPYIQVDVNYNSAVLQIRDSDTGDVLNQFPSEARLEQIQREEAARQREATRPETTADVTSSAQNPQTSARANARVSQSVSAQVSIQEQSSASAPTLSVSSGPSQSQIASAALASAAQASSAASSSVAFSA